MSTIMNASGVTFPDATTQVSAAMPFTGGTFTGRVQPRNLNVYNGTVWNGTATGSQKNIRQWTYNWNQLQNTALPILRNTVAWQDVPFFLTVFGNSGWNDFSIYSGVFGGYGISHTHMNATGSYGALTCTTSAGIGTLNFNMGGLHVSTGFYCASYASMIIYGPQGVTPLVGAIRE